MDDFFTIFWADHVHCSVYKFLIAPISNIWFVTFIDWDWVSSQQIRPITFAFSNHTKVNSCREFQFFFTFSDFNATHKRDLPKSRISLSLQRTKRYSFAFHLFLFFVCDLRLGTTFQYSSLNVESEHFRPFFIFNSFLHFGITSMVRNHKSHLLLTTNLCSLRTVQSNCTANRLTRSVCILWVIQNDFDFFQFFFSWWRLILIGWQLHFRVVWCDFAGILTHRKLTMRLIDNQQTTQSFTLYRLLQKCAIRNRSLPIPLTDDKRLAIN